MAAEFWRVPVSEVKLGSGGAVIQDRGMLRKAMPSAGQYLFSEVGAGVQALALIGLWHEVLNFLASRPGGGIHNKIATLPDIYMGMSYYRPGQRFVGLFPLNDAVTSILGQVVGIAGAGLGSVLPGASSAAGQVASSATEVVGGVKDFRDVREDSTKFHWKKPKPKKSPTLATNAVYLKFSYLQDSGMEKIGSGRVGFPDLHSIVLKTLSSQA